MKKLAKHLHCYMSFRAAKEGVAYDLDARFFEGVLNTGCKRIFGIVISDNRLCRDEQNPDAFTESTRMTGYQLFNF